MITKAFNSIIKVYKYQALSVTIKIENDALQGVEAKSGHKFEGADGAVAVRCDEAGSEVLADPSVLPRSDFDTSLDEE